MCNFNGVFQFVGPPETWKKVRRLMTISRRKRVRKQSRIADSNPEFTDEAGLKKMNLTDKLDIALLGHLSNAEVKDSSCHFCIEIADNLRKLTDAQASYAKVRIQQVMYEVDVPQQHTNI
jgi:hypothetical protein